MSQHSLNRTALWAALAFAASASLLSCSKNTSSGLDAGADVGVAADLDGGGDVGGPDGGSADTGPAVQACSNDEECGPSERCGDNGACIAAVACTTPANCTPTDDSDTERAYCENATVGLGCRCVIPAGQTQGVCKRRQAPCAACTSDEQCGTDPTYFQTPLHEPGKCVTLDGAQVCLEPYNSTKCGCGQSVSIGGVYYCAPQGEPASCSEGTFLCCKTDGNCPPEHPQCDVAHGRCQDLCWYDYENGETVGCRADKVCNVDPDYLTPTSANYGAGRCGAPCSLDGDCMGLRPDFVCRSEPNSDKRCRPPGCLSDLECPTTDPADPYQGYCERSTGECRNTDCRTGADPVTGADYSDCKEGYKCEEPTPGAAGVCLEKNCIESGGAQQYCLWDEFCCGEDRDLDESTDPEPCTDSTGAVLAETGKCYHAPSPWCAACDSADVLSCTKAGYPTSTLDANLCITFGADKDGNDRGDSCMFACTNANECPKGFACTDIEVDCTADATICGDATRCADSGKKDGDGNAIMWCKCDTAGDKSQCPVLDPNTSGSPQARCSNDQKPSNYPWLHCVWTHGCYPYRANCMPE